MTERDTAALSDGAIDRLERAARDAGLFAGHRRTLRSLIAGHAQQDERIASLEAAFIAVRDAIPASIEERCDGIPLAVADLAAQYAHVGRLHSNVSRMLMAVEAERDEARAQLAAVTAERDAALLGCEIAYRRVPTQDEGDAHEAGEPAHAKGECFVAMGGWTGRRCRHCNRWTWGGPTACAGCAQLAEARLEVEAFARIGECVDRWRKHRSDVVFTNEVLDVVDGVAITAPSAPAESATRSIAEEVRCAMAQDGAARLWSRLLDLADEWSAASAIKFAGECAYDLRNMLTLYEAECAVAPAESASDRPPNAFGEGAWTKALSATEPLESASEGARFACDDCAVGRDCPEHDAHAESASVCTSCADGGSPCGVYRPANGFPGESCAACEHEAGCHPPAESAPARGEAGAFETLAMRSERFNDTTGALRGGNAHPDRCVCQRKETGRFADTPHKHYEEPPHACARGCGCEAYEPEVKPPAPRDPAPDCSACKGRGCYNTDDGVEHTCGTCHGWGDTKPREPAPEPAAVLPANAEVTHEKALANLEAIGGDTVALNTPAQVDRARRINAAFDVVRTYIRQQAAYRAKVETAIDAVSRVHDSIEVTADGQRLLDEAYAACRALTDHGAERAGGES